MKCRKCVCFGGSFSKEVCGRSGKKTKEIFCYRKGEWISFEEVDNCTEGPLDAEAHYQLLLEDKKGKRNYMWALLFLGAIFLFFLARILIDALT